MERLDAPDQGIDPRAQLAELTGFTLLNMYLVRFVFAFFHSFAGETEEFSVHLYFVDPFAHVVIRAKHIASANLRALSPC